jgi:branched-subunit amino acid aminotransferase/4-amino-4-deoxychorismate lyase
MTLFESLKAGGGRAEFLSGHIRRLQEGCRAMGFPFPADAIGLLPALLRGLEEENWVRIHVTAGEGGPLSSVGECGVYVTAEQRRELVPTTYRVASMRESFHPPMGGWKTANYWPYLRAMQEARNRDCDEQLLWTGSGFLISGCFANVFIRLKNGQWITPSEELGCRAGVIREWFQLVCGCVSGLVRRSDIAEVDAMILTSSWLGIMAVSQLEGRELFIPSELEEWRTALGRAAGE